MTKLIEVLINGLKYYFDSKDKTLYEDKEKNNPISFLIKSKDDKKDKDNKEECF